MCMCMYMYMYMYIYIYIFIYIYIYIYISSSISKELLHTPCSAYISWKNGQILMFKVSKWLFQFPWHDRVIWKWRHCLTGGQKRSKKDYSTIMDEIISEASNHKVKKEIPQKWEFWLKIRFKRFTKNKNPTQKISE